MTKPSLTLVLLIIAAFIAACSPGNPKAEIEAQEAALQKIMSDQANSSPGAIKEGFNNLIAAYENYLSDDKNTLDADGYFKVAELYESVGQYNKTIQMLETLRTKHADSERSADALFKIGFIYHNNLNDLTKAEDTYRKFINKYPEHHFRDDAEMEIANLGVSPEEIIRRALEKNNTDSSAVPQ